MEYSKKQNISKSFENNKKQSVITRFTDCFLCKYPNFEILRPLGGVSVLPRGFILPKYRKSRQGRSLYPSTGTALRQKQSND